MCYSRHSEEEDLRLGSVNVDLSLEPKEATTQSPEESEQSTEIETNPYGIGNAPESYLAALTQYDEVNPQFFAKANSYAEPSFIYQEL